MAKSRKTLSGTGWSFEGASDAAPPPPCQGEPPVAAQKPRVSVERRGGGKVVTLITRLQHPPEAFKAMAKELKGVCGSGGSCLEDGVMIQGDHAAAITAWLQNKGYRTPS